MRTCRDTIADMAGYTPGEQPGERTVIKLNTNENPYPPSPKVAEALANVATERLRMYPNPVAQPVREAVARAFGMAPEWVLCGNGSDDLLTIAVRTTVDQGGALATPDPSYSLYPVLAEIQGARTVRVPLNDDFTLPDDLPERAAEATLLFIARPNAPTGLACPKSQVANFARRFDGIVWVDEAYADFADDNCVDLVREHPNLVVSRTLSKGGCLAGLRLGFAFANPARIAEMMKVKDSYNVSMLTQIAGAAALDDRDYTRTIATRVRATRERLQLALRDLGFEVVPSQSNFVFARSPVDASQLQADLRDRDIFIRHFPGPRTGDYIRVTVGTDEEIDAFLDTTRDLLSHRHR